MVEAPKYSVTHEDRHLSCQEAVDGPLQEMLDQATTHSWGTIETITAMEEVLKHLRLAYAEAPRQIVATLTISEHSLQPSAW